MINRLKFEIEELVESILDHLPNSLFESESTTFLDPAMGGGQFVHAIEKRLKDCGHSDENIKDRVFGYENNMLSVGYAVNRLELVGTYDVVEYKDFLESDMHKKFDVVVGNPPYNISSRSDKTIAGTSGNTVLYRKFIDKFFESVTDSGVVLMITQRSGIRYASKNHSVSFFVTDTSQFWDYSAGYFVSLPNNNEQVDVTSDTIIRKIYNPLVSRPFSNAIGGSLNSHLESGKVSMYSGDLDNEALGIIETPKGEEPYITGYIRGSYKKAGPKVIFKGLESKSSYIVTDLPHHVGSACTLYFDSIQDAESAKLFILNNPVMNYLKTKLKEKALGLVFRFVRDFDLSQIKTGHEFPKEFNLTEDEIKIIKSIHVS